ncbi:MAG: nucleoside-diphosphate sugar epimerase/dehydratase, partial [Fusobacteriaceae bacterium]
MKYQNKRYISGMFLILLQYIMIKGYVMVLGVEKGISEISFLVFVFFNFVEGIYSFESYLIWEELEKHTKALLKYLAIMTFIGITINEPNDLWKHYLLGILTIASSFVAIKIMRKQLFNMMHSKIVIVGTGESAMKMKDIVNKNNFTMYNLRGFLDATEVMREKKIIMEDEIIGSYNNFDFKGVDEVIIAIPDLTYRQMDVIVNKIEGKVRKIKFIP